jgi:hypothetical protein
MGKDQENITRNISLSDIKSWTIPPAHFPFILTLARVKWDVINCVKFCRINPNVIFDKFDKLREKRNSVNSYF